MDEKVTERDLTFLFEKGGADLTFLKHFEVLSVLKGNLAPISSYIDRAAFKSLVENFPYQDETNHKLQRLMQMGA